MIPSHWLTRAEFAAAAGVTTAAISYASRRALAPAMVSGGSRVDARHVLALEYLRRRSVRRGRRRQEGPDLLEQMPEPGPAEHFQGDQNPPVPGSAAGKSKTGPGSEAGDIDRSTPGSQPGSSSSEAGDIDPGRSPAVLPTDYEPKPEPPPPPRLPPRRNRTRTAEALNLVPEDIRDLADLSLRELVSIFGTHESFEKWLKATREIEKIHMERLKNADKEGELVNRHRVQVGVLDPINTAHERLLSDGAKRITREVIVQHEAGILEPEIARWVSKHIGKNIKAAKVKSQRALNSA